MQKNTAVQLPQFIELGEMKIENLLKILDKHNLISKRIMLLCDENTVSIGGHQILATLRAEDLDVLEQHVDNSDDQNAMRVAQKIEEEKPGLVIGFGGGKVLDVAKLAAGLKNKKYISIPTTLSNDGIASPVSVIKNNENIPVSHITKAPFGVIIDLDIIKKAPRRHLMAGVGDLISNLSAVFDARLAQEKQGEEINVSALQLAESGGHRLLNMETSEVESTIFLQELAHGLVKSGFAMCIWGTSRPASGSEHKISHSIDHFCPRSNGLHGEQVGIAAIFTMALQKNVSLEATRRFYTNIGFPCNLAHLGLNMTEFVNVVLNATKIRPERYTILEDRHPKEKEIEKIVDFLGL
ncbi:MAG: iron-containing alcohol dehydrogenase family protein [candidate division WOR-3 bacterium]|nr:iron-containing alcohol dehydrogenase family protein [candidate division WOR-3 bacterium]